jgi:hypothetical protein
VVGEKGYKELSLKKGGALEKEKFYSTKIMKGNALFLLAVYTCRAGFRLYS